MADVTQIPVERAQFRQLLAANPNYFGTYPKFPQPPVIKLAGNTTYEELTCVGYNTDLSLLEATIQVKQPVGYKGDLCSGGSMEFVRFFLDYGSGWEDAGYAGTPVHDIPNGQDCANASQKPLSYVVTMPLTPKRDACFRPILPNVRAVLSWDAVPSTDPNVPPVWGNVKDVHIQIKPRPWWFGDLVAVATAPNLNLPPQFEEVKYKPIPLPDPPPETLASLAKAYAAKTQRLAVEPHRFGLESLAEVMAPQGVQPELAAAKFGEWEAVKLDWSAALAALLKTSGDTSYEQLDCVGLDNNREWLVATFRIKRAAGYSGTLCQKGSAEHIAFWVDWDNTCQWTYLDTVHVQVHDIASIPADGLHYTAVRPVDLSAVRTGCKKPKIARIRAVLSWGALPSTTDPDAVPYWGNRIDTHVQIKPGVPVHAGERISILGGIGKDDIHYTTSGLTKPNALFALTGTFADPYVPTRECPFGGQIVIQGPGTPFVGTYYRIWVRDNPGDPFTPLKNPIHIVNQFGVGSWVNPVDATGLFQYRDYLNNMDQTLGYWYSSGNAMGEVFLEWTDAAKVPQGITVVYKMQLKHSQPDAAVTLDAGPCHFYHPNESVTGRFVARDPYFGHFRLYTLPTSLNPPNPATATPYTSQTAPSPGDPWTLAVGGLPQCGYVVRVEVYDRTIIGSGPWAHNGNADDKGFCLVP